MTSPIPPIGKWRNSRKSGVNYLRKNVKKVLYCAIAGMICLVPLIVGCPYKATTPISHDKAFELCLGEMAKRYDTNTWNKCNVRSIRGEKAWRFWFYIDKFETDVLVTVEDSGNTSVFQYW
jgi:hypothetical protein